VVHLRQSKIGRSISVVVVLCVAEEYAGSHLAIETKSRGWGTEAFREQNAVEAVV